MKLNDKVPSYPWINFENQNWRNTIYLGEIVTFAAGETLKFSEINGLLLIDKGEAHFHVTSPCDKERLVMILGPNSLLFEIDLFIEREVPRIIHIKKKITAYFFPAEKATELILGSPELLRETISSISKKMTILKILVEQITFYSTGQRLAHFLYSFTKTHSLNSSKKSTKKLFNHSFLAKLIGVNRVTISRIMSDLKNKGLIVEKDGYIHFPKPQKLLSYDYKDC